MGSRQRRNRRNNTFHITEQKVNIFGTTMLHVMYLPGLVGYEEACRLQRKLLYQRYNGEIEDTLVILEHPPTYTIGKSGSLDNVLARQAYLSRENISVFFTDRGG